MKWCGCNCRKSHYFWQILPCDFNSNWSKSAKKWLKMTISSTTRRYDQKQIKWFSSLSKCTTNTWGLEFFHKNYMRQSCSSGRFRSLIYGLTMGDVRDLRKYEIALFLVSEASDGDFLDRFIIDLSGAVGPVLPLGIRFILCAGHYLDSSFC